MTDANPTNPPAPSPDAVVDNRDASRFELVVDGQTAVAEYRRSGQTIDFTHTEVPEALRGQKVGERLVAGAIAAARAEGLTIVATCPYVRNYLRKHHASAE